MGVQEHDCYYKKVTEKYTTLHRIGPLTERFKYICCIYNEYMVTELITLKLDGAFLKIIDLAVKKGSYHNRTEFIRAALREKLDEEKVKEALLVLAPFKGAHQRKTSYPEYEQIRRTAFEELKKKIK